MPILVSKLWIHPVKGCQAIAVDQLELDERGAVGDRRFLVTDPAGRMFTQRTHPGLARIVTALDAHDLILACAGHGELRVPRQDPTAATALTSVWKDDHLVAEECGPAAAAWLTAVLATPARLLRLGPAFRRPVKRAPEHEVNFADAYPLLVISEASLTQLNDRLVAQGAEPVPMDRFRPNVVVAGTDPHAEDEWQRFRVGEVTLRGMTPCARCTVPTIDQHSGERQGPEPLRTLAAYRRNPDQPQEVLFGRNVLNESKSGVIRRGDRIELLPDVAPTPVASA